MKNSLEVIAALLFSSLLSACSSAPIDFYSHSAELPSAKIKSSLKSGSNRNEWISVSLLDDHTSPPKYRVVFEVSRHRTTPAGYTLVPAEKPIKINYTESASRNRHCRISVTTQLSKDKSYTLTGGFFMDRGPIPIITDQRKCTLQLLDDQTGIPVPMAKSAH